jgi:hypothetical protein
MIKKAIVLTTLILITLFSTSVFAQKRRPISRDKTAAPPPAAKDAEPALVPQYEAASGNSPNRVTLSWSFVGDPKGAQFIKMYVSYVYDDHWWQVGRLNEVAITFGMNPKTRVCADECQFIVNIDGTPLKVAGNGSAALLNDGSTSETVGVWMRPEAFKKFAEAKTISIQVGSVNFNLTAQQMEGLRQMLPFLRIRSLP